MRHLLEIIRRLPLAFVICIGILILAAEMQAEADEATALEIQQYQQGIQK